MCAAPSAKDWVQSVTSNCRVGAVEDDKAFRAAKTDATRSATIPGASKTATLRGKSAQMSSITKG
jgi:hypothetical protein